jgi:hypothetical protein
MPGKTLKIGPTLIISDMLTNILNTIQYNNESLDNLMWTLQTIESIEHIQNDNKKAVEQLAKRVGKRLDDVLKQVNKRADDLSNNGENLSWFVRKPPRYVTFNVQIVQGFGGKT